MSEAPDKYSHLFEEEKRGLRPAVFPNRLGWLSFEQMYATRLLTFVHGLLQAVYAGIVVVALFMWFTAGAEGRMLAVILLAALLSSVLTRVAFEVAIVLFRIYEETALTRRGIDDFNSKVQARAKA